MEGLLTILLVALGIVSVIMKRREKPAQRTDRAPSDELRKYLRRGEAVLREVEEAVDSNRRLMREKEAPRQTPRPTPRPVSSPTKRVEPPVRTEAPPRAAATLSKNRAKQLREAVIWAEVLQPPVSKRKR